MTTMSESAGFDLRLIQLVRANPVLYERDVRSTPYDLIKRKTEIWKSIATSLKVDVNKCLLRWRNLQDKLRRELLKEMPGSGGSDWNLLDSMRFIEKYIRRHNERQIHVQSHNIDVPLDDMNAELFIEELVNDEDDPLQEAMDEQSPDRDKDIVVPITLSIPVTIDNSITTNSQQQQQVPLVLNPIPVTLTINDASKEEHIKRIEALLSGLGQPNRTRAEKRIIAFLCKCNLRALNNENIDDIDI